MRTRSVLPAMAVLAATLTGCQPAAGPLSDADVAAIREVFDAVPQLFVAGDFAAWAAVFAEDGVLMPPNAARVEGRAALQAFGEAFPTTTDLSFSDVQIGGRGDLAFGTSAYSMTIAPEGMPEIPDTGKQLAIFQKQPDGSWLVSTAMFNSDLPLPE